jgi:dGTPase
VDLVNPQAHDRPLRDDRLSGKRKTGSIDPDVRSEYERDVDRVYYDYYFRRLAEITQVSSGHDKTLRHNRMTHSLKVAQVARRLVQYLRNEKRNEEGIAAAGGIDHNVVTAAGLLHDVGHPPFGHVGEHQLNRLAIKYHLADGFEGNAQTLRIILNLTAHQRKDDEPAYGLDLTRAVVAACTKYPYPRQDGRRKWGYYKTEETLFEEFVCPLLPAAGTPTLEAEIMDWADDITYAVHDLQDFYTDGIIPLHHLRHTQYGRDTYEAVHQSEFADFWGYVTEKLHRYNDILPLTEARQEFGRYAFTFPESHFHGGRKEAAKIGALASRIITDASKATQVTKNGRLYVEPKMRSIIHAFKQVTWYYVIDHPDLVSTQLGQRAQINQVFSKLYKRVEVSFKGYGNGHALRKDEQWIRKRRLPTALREFTEQLLDTDHGVGAYQTPKQCYARAVIDYIASMTELEFNRIRQRLCPVENYENVDDSDFYRGDEGV